MVEQAGRAAGHVLGARAAESGRLLLGLVWASGWTVAVVADPVGVRVSASSSGRSVSVRGRSVAEVALPLLELTRRAEA